MRYLSTTLLFFLLPWLLAAQITSSAYPDWQYFRKTGRVTSATQTSTDIWFSLSDHLLRIDKASQQISYGGYPYFSGRQIQQIWADTDDQLFLLEGETTIAQREEDAWTPHSIPFNFSFFKMDKILHRRDDGAFICQGSNIDVIMWKFGSNPAIANDIQYPAPWTIEHIVWESQSSRYWISNNVELGYLQNETYNAVVLPENAGKVKELQLDRNGVLWVRTEHFLLKRAEATWARYVLPATIDPDSVSFATLGNGSALVVSEEERTLLRPAPQNNFSSMDYREELANLHFSEPYIFDDNEILWWIDEERKVVNQWQEGQTVRSREPGFWLPFDGNISHMTHDQEGRIWLTSDFQSYFYANSRWWPATTLYPGFPDSIKQVAFNSRCYPLVLRSPDRNGSNSSAELYQLFGSEWLKLPDGRAEAPTLPDGISWIRFDQNDRLLVQRPIGNNAQIWAYGSWFTFLTSDFFPAPSRIYDIEISDDDNIYFMTDLGIFRRKGQNGEYYSLEELGVESSLPTYYARLNFSPSGTRWMTHNHQLFRQTTTGYENIAPDYFETPLEPFRPWDTFTETYVFADDDIWVISYGLGVLHYDGETWTSYHTDNSALPSAFVDYLAKDDRGRIWMSDTRAVSILTPPSTGTPALTGDASFSTLKTYPNPACCQVQASWLHSAAGQVSLRLYNNQGQLLRTIVDEYLPAGAYTYTIDRKDLPAGVYYLHLLHDKTTSVEEIFWK